jgi:hypothetical protein
MQTIQTQALEPQLQEIEADLRARIEVVFHEVPNLVGFALQDSTCLPDDTDRSRLAQKLFITDMEFVVPVGDDWFEEVCEFINDTIADLVAEQVEAFDLLRDRTFARTLH